MAKRSECRLFVGLIAILLIVACGSNATVPPALGEKLDPLTGVTVTFSNRPLILYHDNSGQAAYAKNLLHLGPVQVNRSGTYQYYLWLAGWSTMQAPGIEAHRESLESIIVFADGEPLLLDVAGWTPEAIGTSEPVYLKPVASAVEAYYRVTVDQIRLMAEARDLRLRTSGANSREYGLWDDQKGAKSDLLEFLNRAYF
jgi:hypothetical protein